MPAMADVETGAAPAEGGQPSPDAVTVRRLVPDEWRELRRIRLAALSESPSAFGSTYAQDAALTESDWRGRLEPDSSRGAVFGAHLPGATGTLVGLSGGYVDDPPAAGGTVELVSMWVSPDVRGLRVGQALVAAVLAWARAQGAERVHLWVTEGNLSAERLYQRCGFLGTGETAPLPSDPRRTEIGMVRTLG
jgi:GNAT superfamily N-acetyltransferase